MQLTPEIYNCFSHVHTIVNFASFTKYKLDVLSKQLVNAGCQTLTHSTSNHAGTGRIIANSYKKVTFH